MKVTFTVYKHISGKLKMKTVSKSDDGTVSQSISDFESKKRSEYRKLKNKLKNSK